MSLAHRFIGGELDAYDPGPINPEGVAERPHHAPLYKGNLKKNDENRPATIDGYQHPCVL